MADEPILQSKVICPTCGKPAQPATKPFCSKRCADIDLNRWLVGAYAIPVEGDDDDEDGDGPRGQDPDRA